MLLHANLLSRVYLQSAHRCWHQLIFFIKCYLFNSLSQLFPWSEDICIAMLFWTFLCRVAVPWIKYKNGFWFFAFTLFYFYSYHSVCCPFWSVVTPRRSPSAPVRSCVHLAARALGWYGLDSSPLASTCVGQTWGPPCASLVWAKSMFLLPKATAWDRWPLSGVSSPPQVPATSLPFLRGAWGW